MESFYFSLCFWTCNDDIIETIWAIKFQLRTNIRQAAGGPINLGYHHKNISLYKRNFQQRVKRKPWNTIFTKSNNPEILVKLLLEKFEAWKATLIVQKSLAKKSYVVARAIFWSRTSLKTIIVDVDVVVRLTQSSNKFWYHLLLRYCCLWTLTTLIPHYFHIVESPFGFSSHPHVALPWGFATKESKLSYKCRISLQEKITRDGLIRTIL